MKIYIYIKKHPLEQNKEKEKKIKTKQRKQEKRSRVRVVELPEKVVFTN